MAPCAAIAGEDGSKPGCSTGRIFCGNGGGDGAGADIHGGRRIISTLASSMPLWNAVSSWLSTSLDGMILAERLGMTMVGGLNGRGGGWGAAGTVQRASGAAFSATSSADPFVPEIVDTSGALV